MHDRLTHASFFSGVGGLDMGLERAGFRTVSFSEVDPYACAVLAQRWPGVRQLGDITALAEAERRHGERHEHLVGRGSAPDGEHDGCRVPDATLWTGGFPCTDLSVAGKRRGFGLAHGRPRGQVPERDGTDTAGVAPADVDRTSRFTPDGPTRSGLAFAFLELVGRHRPRFVLLENVPGLLSSHGGRDMAALLGALVELGYGVGYRVLDARHFGVPQRRRRVFILGVTPGGRAGAELAAEVLSVGSRCRRHPPAGVEAGEGTSGVLAAGATSTRTVQSAFGHHGYTLGAQDADGGYLQVAPALTSRQERFNHPEDQVYVGDALGPSPDPRGVRAPDGLAGRAHDRGGVAHYRKSTRAASAEHDETWVPDDVTNTLNGFDVGDARAVELVTGQGSMTDDPLLPPGLDSHRYRCCGNGVVSDVAEWVGHRLADVLSLEAAA